MSTDIKPESSLPESTETTNTSISTVPPTTSVGTEEPDQWQKIWARISVLLADLPEYVTDFFKEYRRPITTIGLIFAALISVKLMLAVLSAINDIPLLSPLFELIGLGYVAWFIYRYLLKASNRQELIEDFNSLKDQVLGRKAA
ncbi:MAG: CAAD domain-containing protein [Almyronema sp.]